LLANLDSGHPVDGKYLQVDYGFQGFNNQYQGTGPTAAAPVSMENAYIYDPSPFTLSEDYIHQNDSMLSTILGAETVPDALDPRYYANFHPAENLRQTSPQWNDAESSTQSLGTLLLCANFTLDLLTSFSQTQIYLTRSNLYTQRHACPAMVSQKNLCTALFI
jgi:hypothetical protein